MTLIITTTNTNKQQQKSIKKNAPEGQYISMLLQTRICLQQLLAIAGKALATTNSKNWLITKDMKNIISKFAVESLVAPAGYSHYYLTGCTGGLAVTLF